MGVEIDFNYGQTFYLRQIDMYSKYLLFETTDNMDYFKDSYEKYDRLVGSSNIVFKIYFDDYKELNNIPYLLYKYLQDNDLLYDD